MGISIIVAMDKNGLIGSDGTLPWHIPADLKYFRETTQGNTVVMGRKTFDSIGRTLPNRRNIMLSRKQVYSSEYVHNIEVYSRIETILQIAKTEEVFIIGGSEIYSQFLPYANRLYITHIDHEFDGDTYFPYYDESDFEWTSFKQVGIGERSPHSLEFAVYDRIMN
jgi:dihydrofolate reductase